MTEKPKWIELLEHETIDKDNLEHYGVLGMKWGRKKGSSELKPKRRPKFKKKNVRDMSDEELRSTINRLNMEKQYKSLTTKDRSFGKNVVKSIFVDSAKEASKEVVKEYYKTQGAKMWNKVKGK